VSSKNFFDFQYATQRSTSACSSAGSVRNASLAACARSVASVVRPPASALDESVIARTAWSAEAMPPKKSSSLMAGWKTCVNRVQMLRVHAAYNVPECRIVGAAAGFAELREPGLEIDEREAFVNAESFERLRQGAHDLLPRDRPRMHQVQHALWSRGSERDVENRLAHNIKR
jgi:hypothetical protein